MMIKHLFFILIIFLAFQGKELAQTDTLLIDKDEVIENLLEETDEETDNSELYDRIEEMLDNQIELNAADIIQLLTVPYMDLASASAIVEHRSFYGNFYSVQELFMVEKLDKNLVSRIIPFLKVDKVDLSTYKREYSTFEDFVYYSRIQLRTRYQTDLQTRRGFLVNKYEGAKFRSYSRLVYNFSDKFSASFVADKDPGEKSLTDFYSFSFALNELFFFDKLIIGDYLVEFGQGLALWSPYSFSKGADIVSPLQRRDKNLIQYRSTDENRFFRGVAASFNYPGLRLSLFYSKNKFDANIDSIAGYISSNPLDGYHRTETELNRKNKGEELFAGGRLDYNIFKNFSIGLLYFHSEFNYPFVKKSSIYDLEGKNFNYYSTAYSYINSFMKITGEFAYNGLSVASINTVQFAVSNSLTLVNSIRNYPRNFTTLHGSAFGERAGVTQNEFGLYNGIIWKSPIGRIGFYYDQFKFPFSFSRTAMPSKGYEYYFDLTTKVSRQAEVYFRAKKELREVNVDDGSKIVLSERNRENIRADFVFNLPRSIRLKNRFELSFYDIELTGYEKGFLTYQDVRAVFSELITVYGRIIFFKTDSYNSAVYEFENDLIGVLSNLPMYGEGIRYYFLLRITPIKKLSISMKYSETYKPNLKSLSSGDSEIYNNIDNRFSLQLDWRL